MADIVDDDEDDADAVDGCIGDSSKIYRIPSCKLAYACNGGTALYVWRVLLGLFIRTRRPLL